MCGLGLVADSVPPPQSWSLGRVWELMVTPTQASVGPVCPVALSLGSLSLSCTQSLDLPNLQLHGLLAALGADRSVSLPFALSGRH